MKLLKKTGKALWVGGAVMLDLANPVNLLFVVLLFVAGFALLNEGMVLVGFVSTLALLSVIVWAGVLAAIVFGTGKTLSTGGFWVFLVISFLASLTIWSFEIFNDLAHDQAAHVAGLAAIMLVFALYLVPRLRRAYQSKGLLT